MQWIRQRGQLACTRTSLPLLPTTNIFSPLVEKARPVGNSSCDDTEKESTKDAVDTSKGVDKVYSFTLSLAKPTTNILAPSVGEGKTSWR